MPVRSLDGHFFLVNGVARLTFDSPETGRPCPKAVTELETIAIGPACE
jgi:hypothetical protein